MYKGMKDERNRVIVGLDGFPQSLHGHPPRPTTEESYWSVEQLIVPPTTHEPNCPLLRLSTGSVHGPPCLRAGMRGMERSRRGRTGPIEPENGLGLSRPELTQRHENRISAFWLPLRPLESAGSPSRFQRGRYRLSGRLNGSPPGSRRASLTLCGASTPSPHYS